MVCRLYNSSPPSSDFVLGSSYVKMLLGITRCNDFEGSGSVLLKSSILPFRLKTEERRQSL